MASLGRLEKFPLLSLLYLTGHSTFCGLFFGAICDSWPLGIAFGVLCMPWAVAIVLAKNVSPEVLLS